MTLVPISTTQFDWATFIGKFPEQITSELNRAGINLQSCEGFVKLVSAYESFADNTVERTICDYLLSHWSVGCYFEMPYYWIEEFRKTDLHLLAIPKGRDVMIGLISGTLKEWKQTYIITKQANGDFFPKLKIVIEAVFNLHKVGFLLENG